MGYAPTSNSSAVVTPVILSVLAVRMKIDQAGRDYQSRAIDRGRASIAPAETTTIRLSRIAHRKTRTAVPRNGEEWR